MKSTELAWAAGFFDGEGSTYVVRKGASRGVGMSITQKHREVLDRFAVAVGVGAVREYERSVPFVWAARSHQDVTDVLRKLSPWLGSIKITQAIRCLSESTWHDGERGKFDRVHDGHGPRRVLKNGQRSCVRCSRVSARGRSARYRVRLLSA